DFVENAWWKASPPGGAGLLPAARHESEVVEFDAGVHEVDQVIWARSLTPLDPRTDACSSVGDEDSKMRRLRERVVEVPSPANEASCTPACTDGSVLLALQRRVGGDAHVLYGS
ncbi:unnamed protein product, partial [Prorocentrum cordatum]